MPVLYLPNILYGNAKKIHAFEQSMALHISSSYFLCNCFGPAQVFEKFTRESTSLLDELAVINENEKSNQPDKDRCVSSPHTTH